MLKSIIVFAFGILFACPLPAQDPPNVFIARSSQTFSIPNVFAVPKPSSHTQMAERAQVDSGHPINVSPTTLVANDFGDFGETANWQVIPVTQPARPANSNVVPACPNCVQPAGHVNCWPSQNPPRRFFRK